MSIVANKIYDYDQHANQLNVYHGHRRKNSEHIKHDEHGRVRLVYKTKDGLLHGLYVQYYLNGMPSYSCEYVDGQKHGVETTYFENGKVIQKRKFKNGFLCSI